MSGNLTNKLEKLYQQQIEVGYISPDRLKENRYYTIFDNHYGINFKAQVNYLRDSYINDMQVSNTANKPSCPICPNNAGRPGYETLKTIDINLGDHTFFAQYSPYPLFLYHTVVISKQHRPMRMDRQSVIDLIHFIDQAPSYIACSNSDTEWAGASILQHHHYQMFKNLDLPIQHAKAKWSHHKSDHEVEWLNYPIACCRVTSTSSNTIIDIGSRIISLWKNHRINNTCNLLVDKSSDQYHLYIIFRNPKFRTPCSLHVVKSEGIGIVEVCGYGIYPVPHGDQENDAWNMIDNHSLAVIHGIISGNNPIMSEYQSDFWHQVVSVLTTRCSI